MQREKERKREAERGKENGSGIRRETGIETGRVQMEGRKRDERKGENAWKVGSFTAGSNDPGCIDSWGCSVVRVAGRRRG